MQDSDEPQKREAPPALRLVCFHVHGQELGFPIASVRETIRMRPVTHVCLTPAWLLGIFSLRGEIVPAVDITPWLGMPPLTVRDDGRVLILRSQTKVIGIVADGLAELRSLTSDDVTPPPQTLSPEQSALCTGVAATATGTVRLLDPDALFASQRMRSLESPPSP